MASVFSLKAGPVTFHLQKKSWIPQGKVKDTYSTTHLMILTKLRSVLRNPEKKSFWEHLIENKGLALETAGTCNCAVLTNF